MKQRCYRRAHPFFHAYGGRGIQVAKRWRYSFATFLADVGRRPSAHHSLDRINNDGDYEPGNCRWATPQEQASNRSGAHMLTVGGQTATLTEWSRRTHVSHACILRRLKRGALPEEALRATQRYARPLTFQDVGRAARRFWQNAKRGAGCWQWTGSRSNGYGIIGIGGHRWFAHRVSRALTHGEVVSNAHVLHKCDNRLCVRPEHLYIGDDQANARDRALRGRRRVKLAPAAVVLIRRLFNSGQTKTALAARFKVARTQIANVLARRQWAWVP